MKFPDYVNILRKHFKKYISVEELCRTLFDSIIISANVTDSHGELLDINKTEISRIMNSKKNIPTQLQDHVYDTAVLDGMNDYFQKNIVSELVPDTSDLFYQMLQLINTDNDISPSHKASLRLQAKETTASLFLADVFIYVLRKENKATSKGKVLNDNDNAIVTTELPDISLCGISLNGDIAEYAEMATFKVRDKYTVEEYEEIINKQYKHASLLYCVRDEIDAQYSIIKQLGISSVMQSLYPYEEISESNKLLMRDYAEEHDISLPDNFFNLGNLRRINLMSIGARPDYSGTPKEKEKIKILEAIPDYIKNYKRLKQIDRAFRNVLFIRLAIQNTGKSVSEDMRIRLKFNANAFFDADDIAHLDPETLHLIFDHYKCDSFFDIERTANYLSYYSSIDVVPSCNYIPKIPFVHEQRNYAEEWRDYLPYYVEQKGSDE